MYICFQVDFNDIRAQSQAERQRIDNEEKRKKKIMADKLAKVLKDISGSQFLLFEMRWH